MLALQRTCGGRGSNLQCPRQRWFTGELTCNIHINCRPQYVCTEDCCNCSEVSACALELS